MSIFNQLLEHFSNVSSLFHFGNALSFLDDLTVRIEHLCSLKKGLEDDVCDIYVNDKILSESQRKNISIESLEESIQQLNELVKVFKDFAGKDMFKGYHDIFQQRFKECLKKWEPDILAQPQNVDSDREPNFKMDIENGDETGILLDKKPMHHVPSSALSSILGMLDSQHTYIKSRHKFSNCFSSVARLSSSLMLILFFAQLFEICEQECGHYFFRIWFWLAG